MIDFTKPEQGKWYWIYTYDQWFPAIAVDNHFLIGGLGDISRDGIDVDDIEELGPEITHPNPRQLS